jgi:hypothetical protein
MNDSIKNRKSKQYLSDLANIKATEFKTQLEKCRSKVSIKY